MKNNLIFYFLQTLEYTRTIEIQIELKKSNPQHISTRWCSTIFIQNEKLKVYIGTLFILFCVFEQTNTGKTSLYKWQSKINNCHTNTIDFHITKYIIYKERLCACIEVGCTVFPIYTVKMFS